MRVGGGDWTNVYGLWLTHDQAFNLMCVPLRFATELAGRKARRREWTGLAEEMIQAGWFDS